MSVRRALLLLGLAVGCGLIAPPSAHAGPWSLQRGQYATDVFGSWYSAYNYHDQDGNRPRLAGGGHMERRAVTWDAEFGWRKHTSVRFSLPFESISRQPDGSPPPQLHSAIGLGDGRFGLKYSLANGTSAAAIEVDASFPMYTRMPYAPPEVGPDYNVLKQTNDPVHGDGAGAVAGVLHVGSALGHSAFVQGYGGYNLRFRKFQPQVLAGADFGLWLGQAWMIGGSYRAAIANQGDNPTADATWHMAGPILLYRVDDKLDVFASTMHVASGKNLLHTDEVRFGFTFKQSKLDRSQGFLGTSRRP